MSAAHGSNPNPPPAPILLLVRDLMFASRIGSAAQEAGVAIRGVRDLSKLAELAGHAAVLDLNQPGTIEAAVAWKARTGGVLVGFVSHVDTETIGRARAAGVDRIVARGAFVAQLPQILRDLSRGSRPSPADLADPVQPEGGTP